MNKPYEEPEFNIIIIELDGVLNGDVIHASFERGGQNTGFDWNDGNDEDFPLDGDW